MPRHIQELQEAYPSFLVAFDQQEVAEFHSWAWAGNSCWLDGPADALCVLMDEHPDDWAQLCRATIDSSTSEKPALFRVFYESYKLKCAAVVKTQESPGNWLAATSKFTAARDSFLRDLQARTKTESWSFESPEVRLCSVPYGQPLNMMYRLSPDRCFANCSCTLCGQDWSREVFTGCSLP